MRVCSSHLVALQSLEMCGGAVTDAGAAHLAPLTRMTHLSLAHNTRVTDASLPVIQAMSELVFLNLTRSRLTGPGIQRLACLSVRASLNGNVASRHPGDTCTGHVCFPLHGSCCLTCHVACHR